MCSYTTTAMCKSASGSTFGGEIDTLLAAAGRIRALRSLDRDPAEISAGLVRLRHACDLLELEFAALASQFADTDEYEAAGAVSPISWIRHECRMSGHAAATAVCVGEQEVNLPLSTSAMTEGGIGFAHLALLARTAEALADSPAPAGFDEPALLERALAHTVSRFRHDCEHARHAGDAARFLDEHVEAVEARRLELMPGQDGTLWIRGVLDPVGGATVRAALEPLSRPGADDLRDRPKRFADALVELASHSLDHAVVRGSQRPHLQVTASLETLIDIAGAPAGELELGAPIAAATVQRLACDASVSRVLLGPDSAILDVGHSRRIPSAATRRALDVRDKGCAWPGCDRPASWTEAHHLKHWAHGGVTELNNLVLICHRHHWMVHEGGWRMVRTQEDELRTIPPLPGFWPRARGPDVDTAA